MVPSFALSLPLPSRNVRGPLRPPSHLSTCRPPVALASPPSAPPPTPPARDSRHNTPGHRRPERRSSPSDSSSSQKSFEPSHAEDSVLKHVVGSRSLASALYRAGAVKDASVVVLFCRAAWCRSCATLGPKVARIATQAEAGDFDFTGAIVWHTMDIVEEANRALAKEIGAEMLPTLVFYRPADLSLAPHAATDGLIPGASEEAQAAADSELIASCFMRKFIAGPFGASRLQQNLEDVLCTSST